MNTLNKDNLRTVTLQNGVTLNVSLDAFDDYELMEDLSSVNDTNNMLTIVKVCNKLLGKDNKEKLFNVLRNEKGIVPFSKVQDAIGEIFEKLGDSAKNS